jgi:hypothetical protein
VTAAVETDAGVSQRSSLITVARRAWLLPVLIIAFPDARACQRARRHSAGRLERRSRPSRSCAAPTAGRLRGSPARQRTQAPAPLLRPLRAPRLSDGRGDASRLGPGHGSLSAVSCEQAQRRHATTGRRTSRPAFVYRRSRLAGGSCEPCRTRTGDLPYHGSLATGPAASSEPKLLHRRRNDGSADGGDVEHRFAPSVAHPVPGQIADASPKPPPGALLPMAAVATYPKRDTTIFSRAGPPLRFARFAGNSGRFGGRERVQISLRRAAVSRTLRPTRSLVGLFVSGGDTGRQRARSPTGRYPNRARSSRLRTLPDGVRGNASTNAIARGSL